MTLRVETAPDGKLRVHPETRAEWRAWLEANHERREGVWLVSWRSAAGDRPRLTYEDQIGEALCFGWVDAVVNTIDAQRTSIWMSPRRRGSGWSRPNKLRVAQLEADGLMQESGRRVIEAAQADGSWAMYDAAEDGIVADDLAAAFEVVPGSRERFDGFTKGSRKVMLAWLAQAKRPETRAARAVAIAEAAGRGELAGPLRPKGGG